MTTKALTGSAPGSSTLEVYRDDGPLSRALGESLGRVIRLPPILLLVAGVMPLLALMAIDDGSASDGAAGLAIGWLVLLGGVSSGRPHTDRLRWTAIPTVRFAEYAGLLWLAALAGGSGPAAAFALLAALAFRHYDLVYRLRYQGTTPPRWVGDVAGGWEGRLVAGWVLLATDALPAGFFTLAAVLGAVFVGESIASWTRIQRDRAVVEYEDEEAEEE
jgi:Family of unknown function (DUF5941)